MARRSSGWAAAAALLLLPLTTALAATSAPSADAPPAPVPSAQLLREAETAYAEIRRISDLAGPDAALDELERRISRAEREIAGLRAGAFAPPALASGAIDYLQADLADREGYVNRLADQLDRRAERLDAGIASLRRLAGIWRLTAASLDAEAPSLLAARAAEVRDRASALEQVVRKRLASVLELQDRVLALKLAAADMLATARAAESVRRQELFEIDSMPLWRAFEASHPFVAPGRFQAIASQLRATIRYVSSTPARALAHLALCGILVAVALAVARKLPPLPLAKGSVPEPAELVSRHPVSSAVLLALVASPFFHPAAPAPFSLFLLLAGIVPFVRIAEALAPRWKRQLRWLAALFVLDRAAAAAPDLAPVGRLVLLAIDAVALAGCVAGMRPGGFLRLPGESRLRGVLLAAGATAATLFALSAFANVFGNVSLSQLFTDATLASTCAAALASCGAVMFGGLLRAGLQLPWSQRFRVVRNHQPLVLRRAQTLFRAFAVLVWSYWTLRAFRATDSVRAAAGAVLASRLKVGALDFTVGDVAAFALTLAIAVWLSRAIKFTLDESVLPALEVTRGRAAAISTTAQYLVFAFGFWFAILAAGMELTRVTVLLGTLGVGIGFGLQGIVRDFVCGLVLLYEQPMQVDDVVELGTLTGTVQRIGLRSCTVRKFDGAEVIVPNSNFVSTEVVNWTRTDRLRRVDIAVKVAYGSDPRRVTDLLLAAARASPGIAATPEPMAVFSGFGESALQFELRVWTVVDDWVANASRLRAHLSEALPQSGIAIPVPQLDLWVRSTSPVADNAAAIPGVTRIEPPSFPRR